MKNDYSKDFYSYDKTYTTVLKAAKYFVDAVNNITEHIKNSNSIPDLEEKIGEVETAFNEAINSELDALEIFNSTIYDLFSIFDKYGDEDESLFSFLEYRYKKFIVNISKNNRSLIYE